MSARIMSALGILAVLSVGLPSAHARNSVQRTWTTFVVHSVTVGDEEKVAASGTSLVSQPVTSQRAARLDAVTPSQLGLAAAKPFPAGTKMFGVKSASSGWIYCAVAESTTIWGGYMGSTTCYQDADNDGRFDSIRDSGSPFSDIPLFVFQPGPPKALAQPAPYTLIDYREGPRVALGYIWKPIGPKARRNEPPPPITAITITESILVGERSEGISRPREVDLSKGPQTVAIGATVFAVLGVTADGQLRYRVKQTTSSRIYPLELVLRVY